MGEIRAESITAIEILPEEKIVKIKGDRGVLLWQGRYKTEEEMQAAAAKINRAWVKYLGKKEVK